MPSYRQIAYPYVRRASHLAIPASNTTKIVNYCLVLK